MNILAEPYRLTDKQWQVIAPLIPPPSSAATRGRPPIDDRAVLEGIFWKIITGSAWYHLPPVYPSWQTCYRRYNQWRHNGLFTEILSELYSDLQDGGGLDIEAAVRAGILGLGYVNGELQFKYPPVLQDTWQLKTALIFMALWKDRTEMILKDKYTNSGASRL
jgi:hypothetical protein